MGRMVLLLQKVKENGRAAALVSSQCYADQDIINKASLGKRSISGLITVVICDFGQWYGMAPVAFRLQNNGEGVYDTLPWSGRCSEE